METSAGLILYRFRNNTEELEFFVCHPGGPYHKNNDVWYFPKGNIEKTDYHILPSGYKCSETHAAWTASYRDFYEETGDISPMLMSFLPMYLGKIKQSTNKNVIAFAMKCHWNLDPEKCYSNEIEIEHPSKSGEFITIPENDKFAWMTFDELKNKTHPKHFSFYEQIIENVKKK